MFVRRMGSEQCAMAGKCRAVWDHSKCEGKPAEQADLPLLCREEEERQGPLEALRKGEGHWPGRVGTGTGQGPF